MGVFQTSQVGSTPTTRTIVCYRGSGDSMAIYSFQMYNDFMGMPQEQEPKKVPIIIPAYQEGATIDKTLESLEAIRDVAEPVIIENGPKDNTEEIAKQFGATYLYTESAGKLPAMQHAIKELGVSALDTFILLDADTQPKDTRKWFTAMTKAVESHDKPWAASMRKEFSPRPEKIAVDPERERRFAKQITHLGHLGSVAANLFARITKQKGINNQMGFGAAQAINFHGDEEGLQQMIDLPHIWYGEELAYLGPIAEKGGYTYLKSKETAVQTSLPTSFGTDIVDHFTKPDAEVRRYKAQYDYGDKNVLTYREWKAQNSPKENSDEQSPRNP